MPINADRNRWSPLARAAYAAGKIYQFVRDEQDRDLLRELRIRAREDEDWDRLEDWLGDEPIPELYKNDLRDAFEDLARLSDADWDDVDTADERDWDVARNDLGGLISDAEWDNLIGDYADIDRADYWEDSVEVDSGDLSFTDNFSIEDGTLNFGQELDLAEDYRVDDLGIDSENDDLGGYETWWLRDLVATRPGGYDDLVALTEPLMWTQVTTAVATLATTTLGTMADWMTSTFDEVGGITTSLNSQTGPRLCDFGSGSINSTRKLTPSAVSSN